MAIELQEEKMKSLNDVRSQAFVWFTLCFYLIARISITYRFATVIKMPLAPQILMWLVIAGAVGSFFTFYIITLRLKYMDFQTDGWSSLLGMRTLSWKWQYLRNPVYCVIVFEAMMLARRLVNR